MAGVEDTSLLQVLLRDIAAKAGPGGGTTQASGTRRPTAPPQVGPTPAMGQGGSGPVPALT